MFDETNSPHSDSTSAVATEAEPTMEQNQPETIQSAEATEASSPGGADEKAAPVEDFASALETFTSEAEEAVSEDRVIKGTVLKLTGTHVVVDIGAKSEGMLPLAEVLDHEGKPKFQPGDEINVMRSKGEAEEGYINLSFQKAQRIHAWEEIEKAYNEKRPIKAVVVDRIKGGLTVDIHGAHAFLPGSQVDLRPIRNLDGMGRSGGRHLPGRGSVSSCFIEVTCTGSKSQMNQGTSVDLLSCFRPIIGMSERAI